MSRPATRLVLLRHGETQWNRDHRMQGQLDVGSCNELGVQQARRAAGVVVAAERPAALYSSDLSRALRTAQEVARVSGLEIRVDRRLREADVGSFGGLTRDEVTERDPRFVIDEAAGLDVRRSPEGENGADVRSRMAEVLGEIAERHLGECVLVATHGFALRMGTAALLGWTFEMSNQLGGLGNCCWSVLEQRDDRWRLLGWNRSVDAR